MEVLPGQVRAALVDHSGKLLRRTTAGFDPAAPEAAGVDAAVRQAARECFEGRELTAVRVAAAGTVSAALRGGVGALGIVRGQE
ncbi:hypothetical protein ACWDHW_43870 [Streptomyces melanosporofaciens]|uniref:hypothetical protein n=1 Tax=Streptomyces sp. CY1 TaxID=3388313 RepID=UPI0039A27C6F